MSSPPGFALTRASAFAYPRPGAAPAARQSRLRGPCWIGFLLFSALREVRRVEEFEMISQARLSDFFNAVPEAASGQERIDERALSRLRWRCRRGLLENDLLIERFFVRHEEHLTVRQGRALADLMELGDPDLLDLLLARKSLNEVEPALDRADVNQVLNMLKGQPP